MKVQAHAIETFENKKYIVCAVENGGGVFRLPLPDDNTGESIKRLLNSPGTVVHLSIDDATMKVVSISAVA